MSKEKDISDRKKKSKLLEQMGLIDFHLKILIKENDGINKDTLKFLKEKDRISANVRKMKKHNKITLSLLEREFWNLINIFDQYTKRMKNGYKEIKERINKSYLHIYRNEDNLERYMKAAPDDRESIREELRDMRLQPEKLPKFQSAMELRK